MVAGLVALALLGLGEAAPAAFPVQVTIEAHGASLEITTDGQPHNVTAVLGPPWRGLSFEQPGPLQREYQVDGSDTTATNDRHLSAISTLLDSPLYQVDAWLRDESGYSRWERVTVTDLSDPEQPVKIDGRTGLPDAFRVQAVLRRPEAAARVWLIAADDDHREGLELDRDRRNARWVIQRGGAVDALPRWFFPEEPAPFFANLLHLLGRSAAAGYVIALVTLALSRGMMGTSASSTSPITPNARAALRVLGNALLAAWFLAAALVTDRLYHQLPHILDAVSYTFQASLFAAGRLAFEDPPLATAFKGPFEVVWRDRVFSQYPPGAAAVYAAGQLVGLEWLVGPVACVVLIGATSWTAGALFGSACGFVVLCLGVLSPFVLFQAGSFLSHPIAGGLLAAALAAFVNAERCGQQRWFAVTGVLLGASFVTREASSVLFVLPLGLRLVSARRWSGAIRIASASVPFVLLYLLYNLVQTGSPTILPRALFDPSDHFGFGDGTGFNQRHTLAAGLANTDELLTLLQFSLFGWPPLVALGLLGVPFLLGRATTWDALAAMGFGAFVIAYAAYFYHGIALGPRYYFEALPWLLILAGRGVQTLARMGGGYAAPASVVGLLSLHTLLFYTPLELERRIDLGGMPNGRQVRLSFVQSGLFGPRLDGLQGLALVVTGDWWLYNTALVPLNCGRLPDCQVLFALANTPADVDQLREAYPGRTLLRAVDNAGRIDLVPS